MKFSKKFKFIIAMVLCVSMSHLPETATAAKMISTSTVAAQLDRAQAQQEVQDYLGREDVQKALVERGVSPEEVSHRLANLSEAELRQLAGQIQEARAGGDILIAILVIVLIIYLIRRI